MKMNVGSIDRVVRIVLALVLLALSLTGVIPGVVGIIADVLAAVFLVTAIVGFCPLYALLKLNTRHA